MADKNSDHTSSRIFFGRDVGEFSRADNAWRPHFLFCDITGQLQEQLEQTDHDKLESPMTP